MNVRFICTLAGMALALAGAPAEAQEGGDATVPHFDIGHYDVHGNTLLPAADVDALLRPFAGKGQDFGTIQRAVDALEAAYHARGYTMVLVVLPEQELAQGAVRLDVIEPVVGKVLVKGNRYASPGNVRRALPALREGATPNLQQLGASLNLANENPARRMEVQLAAGSLERDVDAVVTVADQRPWSASVNIDNTGTAESGKTHAGVVLQNANLWGLDHVASLQYTTALEHPDKVAIYGAGYHVPLYALGDSLDFFASYSNVDSGNVTAGIFDLAVSGRGTMAGARYTKNFAKQGNYDGKLVFGIDHKAYRNSLQLAGVELGGDVTVHPLSAAWIGAWRLEQGETSASVTLVRNIPGGDHSRQDDITAQRAGAKAGYTALRGSAMVSQVLPGDWQWRFLANGQYTPDALIPGEQFGLGGASSVRGFTEREVANDTGVNLNLELYTPSWCGAASWQCRALAFYDTGAVRRNHALPGEVDSTTIGSVGLGLRVLASRYANLQLDYAHVVHAGATGRQGANRLHLRLALTY